MSLTLTINGQIDPVATYAAILSTAIAVWEFIKWRSRHSIRLRCNPNMLFIPSTDKKTYIIANVTNTGETATTITHLLMYYWPSVWHKIFRRGRQSFIVNSPDVPKIVQPGEQWMGQAHQDENIERMAKDGVLFMGVIHSLGKKEIMQRIVLGNPSKPKNAKDRK